MPLNEGHISFYEIAGAHGQKGEMPMQVIYITACPGELLAVAVAQTSLKARRRIDEELVEALPGMRFYFGEPLSFSARWAMDEDGPLIIKVLTASSDWQDLVLGAPVLRRDAVAIYWLRPGVGTITRDRLLSMALVAVNERNFRVPTGH
jgi:hypothetical protein